MEILFLYIKNYIFLNRPIVIQNNYLCFQIYTNGLFSSSPPYLVLVFENCPPRDDCDTH